MSVYWRLQKTLQRDGPDFVVDLYRELLEREPDATGLRDHLRSLTLGRTKFEVFQSFVSSAEFHTRLIHLGSDTGTQNTSLLRLQKVLRNDNELFVTELYKEVLNREPDSSGLLTQLGAMSNGLPKDAIVKALLQSEEIRTKLNSAPTAVDEKISIIIAAHNSVSEVKACVESLKKTIVHMPHEIIVVDNGSAYDIREALYYIAKTENVHLILKPGVDNIGGTLNTGIRMADGNFILVTSHDVIFQEPGWLEILHGTMKLSPNIGIVKMNVLPDGKMVSNNTEGLNRTVMLIRKSVFEQVGYFSSQFTDTTVITDFCARAAGEGFRTLCGDGFSISNTEQLNEVSSVPISPFRNMEVVYVLELTGVSGGIKDVFEHVNRLHNLGYRVHLFALDGQPSWFPLKVQVRRFKDYQAMVQELKQMNALKVATWWKTLSIVMESCDVSKGGRGIPFYLVQDIEESYYPNEPIMKELVRQTYHAPVHLVTIADWTAKQLADRFSRQAANVSIGVDLTIFKPKRTHSYNPKSILACSRKSQHLKGFHVTTEAVKLVSQSVLGTILNTFGVEQPDVIGIPASHVHAPSDEVIASLYSNCGVFVQTSNHEGFGLPILEAMACGAPVVTTKADGNEEFCLDGYNCVMVECGNIEKVAQGIIRVLTDHEFANYLANNGRQTALRYNWSRVLFRLNNVFGNFTHIPD